MASIAQIIAGAGALAGGYVKGRQIARENDWEDEERAQKRQKWADDKALREALNGGTPDRNAATMTAGPTDLADVGSFSGGGAAPRSSTVPAEVVQRVGANVYSDSDAAARAAEMENFATGADEAGSAAAKTESTPAYRVKGVGVFNDPAEAIGASQQAGEDARLAQAKTGISGPLDRAGTDAYLQRKAPQVIDAYLKQGNLEGAKRYRDFIDSESGRAYVHDWSKGVRKLMIGDHQGALATWQDLYNRQLYDDGNTVKLSPTEDGKQVRADFFDQSGKQVHSVTKPIDAFAKQAGFAMAPEKLIEFQAQQQAKREQEGAVVDRQLQVEQLRQEGRDAQDDRREERLQQRLDAQGQQLERRLVAQGGRGGLTAAQQRSNAEIDAAREATAGLTPEEIRQRTAKTSDTGRENKNFDGALARQVTLAGRRKVGDDELFDAPKPKPAAPAFDRADVAKRFRADKTMNMRTLGKETPHGVEVMEKGKLIGYFQ
jgi:hypothetical protein